MSLKKDLTASRTRLTIASTERTPAARNWRIRLPVVGSIYMDQDSGCTEGMKTKVTIS